MDWISSLERRFGSWAIPHLYLYLIGIQVIGYIYLLSSDLDGTPLVLNGSLLLENGEWWRLLSFMMLPKSLNVFWFALSCYVFSLIGSALEHQWGSFRFNLFIWIGYLLTVVMAFVVPHVYITNFYFLGSVFMAFATLFPDFEFRIYFILPVKAKWLGWLTAGIYLLTLMSGQLGDRLCIGAAFANYALFFGKGFVRNLGAAKRRKAFQAEAAAQVVQSRHQCSVCGATDKSSPSLHFRYCSTCGKCFCEEHITNHDH